MSKLLVLDTETTGLSHADDKIVEVAWLELDEDIGVVLDSEFSTIVNPGIPINCAAAGVNQVYQEDITEDTPVLGDLDWPQGDIILVCHTVAFDRPFVEPYLNIVAEPCTMRLSRRLLPDAPDHKLQTLGCYCGLSREQAHRAMGDVLTTAWLLDYLVEGSGLNIEELVRYASQPYIFPRMPFGKHKGEMMEDVPRSYLGWLSKQDLDMDMRATVDKYLL